MPTPAPTVVPTPEPTPVPTKIPALYGKIIGIDPGHQQKGNNEKEAVAPGSKEKKAKVASGTSGRYSGVPEYVVNLDISLQLRDALEAQGATVIMSRETHDVDISNQERAIMMNEAGCDLVLRIHCNGAESKTAQGIGLYIRKTGTGAEDCMAAAQALLPRMIEATGAESDGIFRRDTYTGLNWSEVPCILVEMGFMSNPEEDMKLVSPDYQQLLVKGMVEGVCEYFGR
jgi:N-acetylmuramoyl-L-alanine amidase